MPSQSSVRPSGGSSSFGHGGDTTLRTTERQASDERDGSPALVAGSSEQSIPFDERQLPQAHRPVT